MSGNDAGHQHEDRAETAAFIVPPPGIVPNAPAAPPNTTERPRSRPVERSLPSFAPVAVPGLPAAPPAAPAAPPVATAAAEREWRLSGESGIEVRLTSRALLGRAPDASAFPGCVRVAIGDPERTVSKTHALLEPDGAALRVTDLRSTNGTRIERADGAPAHELPPGASAHLMAGDVLVLGEFRLSVATTP